MARGTTEAFGGAAGSAAATVGDAVREPEAVRCAAWADCTAAAARSAASCASPAACDVEKN